MHCHETYFLLRSDKDFSGNLPEHKIPLMAEKLGKSIASVKRKLAQLQEMGIVEKMDTCWMLTGQDKIVALAGRTRNRKMDVTAHFGNVSNMTTFGYGALVSRQAIQSKRKRRKEKNGNPSTAIPLAASLTAKAANRSGQTIHKQRAKAKKLGIISYKRNITFFKDANQQLPKFMDGLGGKFFLSKNGTMLHEGPALITAFAPSKCTSIRKSLKPLAAEQYRLKFPAF